VLFCVFCVLYCIVVPLPSGTYPLAVNNNNKKKNVLNVRTDFTRQRQ
jgi:hypothetical protein